MSLTAAQFNTLSDRVFALVAATNAIRKPARTVPAGDLYQAGSMAAPRRHVRPGAPVMAHHIGRLYAFLRNLIQTNPVIRYMLCPASALDQNKHPYVGTNTNNPYAAEYWPLYPDHASLGPKSTAVLISGLPAMLPPLRNGWYKNAAKQDAVVAQMLAVLTALEAAVGSFTWEIGPYTADSTAGETLPIQGYTGDSQAPSVGDGTGTLRDVYLKDVLKDSYDVSVTASYTAVYNEGGPLYGVPYTVVSFTGTLSFEATLTRTAPCLNKWTARGFAALINGYAAETDSWWYYESGDPSWDGLHYEPDLELWWEPHDHMYEGPRLHEQYPNDYSGENNPDYLSRLGDSFFLRNLPWVGRLYLPPETPPPPFPQIPIRDSFPSTVFVSERCPLTPCCNYNGYLPTFCYDWNYVYTDDWGNTGEWIRDSVTASLTVTETPP